MATRVSQATECGRCVESMHERVRFVTTHKAYVLAALGQRKAIQAHFQTNQSDN